MKGKDRVYEQLVKMLSRSEYAGGVTATELEGCLDIKRSVISHYLNLLLAEGKVSKTNTRPVRFYIQAEEPGDQDTAGKDDAFGELIGADGSLSMQVEQCKSAVVYPPQGLPVIINGSSGVGKSFLAALIYRYAVNTGVIGEDAPFAELNCADYANNPELLSSVLFGYVEGAFTGAVKGKKGLMDEADGGYLFLDEIHRLSFENQEKLFLYLDKGRFRRLGENEGWHSVRVRFIFATTEDTQKTLLETFYRRIPLRITLPDFQQRPLLERLALIHYFYRGEAEKLDRDMEIAPEVLDILAFSVTKGNIGMLKNYIKLSCANAYKSRPDKGLLFISKGDLPYELVKEQKYSALKGQEASLYVHKNSGNIIEPVKQLLNSEETGIGGLIQALGGENGGSFKEPVRLFIKKVRRKLEAVYGFDYGDMESGDTGNQLVRLMYHRLKVEIDRLAKKYGVSFSEEVRKDLFSMLMYVQYKLHGAPEADSFSKEIQRIRRSDTKAFLLSSKLINSLQEHNGEQYDMLQIFFPVIFSEVLKIDADIQVIIATHGDSTASSIASVANTLCGAYLFEPFDMPITDDSRDIVRKVNRYIEEIDTRHGLILLVDMGSLQEMYEPIKNNLKGELLIINNVTTYIAIDIGFKILQGNTIQEIIEKSRDSVHTELRYYEGITEGDNIIISCISGIGIARKLKEIFENCLADRDIEIVTLEYAKLKSIIQSENSSQLKRTKLIITTNNLDTSPIPSINIENIVSDRGHEMLAQDLNGILSGEDIRRLSEELIKFFSAEGISSQLGFLNPNIVVNEVENVIKQYEEHYRVTFENHLRLNLYMHISIMIERLMTGEREAVREPVELTKPQREFVEVTDSAFASIAEKYHIRIPMLEILLIYEVLASKIYKS